MRKFTFLIASLFIAIAAMAQITDVSQLSNNKCYQIRSIDAQRGVFYAAENAEYLSTCGGTHSGYPNQGVAIDINNTTQQFALILHEEKYYLYSVSEKKFAVRADDGFIQLSTTPSHFVTVEKSNSYFIIKMNGSKMLNLAMPLNAIYGVNANYDETDDGNKIVITEAGEFNPEEALLVFALKKEELRQHIERQLQIIGNAVGQLSSTNENFSNDLKNITDFYDRIDENIESATYEEFVQKFEEINTLTATLNRNMPVDGKAYVFVNVTSEGEKSYLNWNGTKIVAVNDEDTKPMTATFICRKLDNGKYVFVNNDGKYLTFQCDEASYCPDSIGNGYLDNYDTSNNKYCDWTITYGDLDNDYQRRAMLLEVQAKGKINYLLHKYSSHTFHSASRNDKYNDGDLSSYWILEDAEYANTPKLNAVGTSPLLTSDLHNKAMATFSAPFPTVLPDGVTAYYATEDNGEYISIKPFESRTVPANTGIILVGENAGNVTMVPAAGETPEAISNNLLLHSAGADKPFNSGYILSSMNGEAGFYKALAITGMEQTYNLSMNKAYIAIDAIQNSVPLRLLGTTSIEKTEVDNENIVTYDLTGRRISEITKPGIYIINGKKVLVK